MKEIEEIGKQKTQSQTLNSETEYSYDQPKATVSSNSINESTSNSSDYVDANRKHYSSPVPLSNWTPMNTSTSGCPVFSAKYVYHRSYKSK